MEEGYLWDVNILRLMISVCASSSSSNHCPRYIPFMFYDYGHHIRGQGAPSHVQASQDSLVLRVSLCHLSGEEMYNEPSKKQLNLLFRVRSTTNSNHDIVESIFDRKTARIQTMKDTRYSDTDELAATFQA